MGPRTSLVIGVAAGLVLAALFGAALVSLASGGTVTLTLAPSAPATPAIPAITQPPPGPTLPPVSPPASGTPSPSATPGALIGDPGAGGTASVSAPPGSPSAPGSPGASFSPPSATPVTPPPSPITGGLFGVGSPAPSLSVERLGGGSIDLASLRGHPVWVAFTGTYCPSCRDEYPAMESFALRYAYTGLVVIAIHVKDDPGVVASLTQELGITFPIGLDPAGAAARDWRAVALPIHFWVDRGGIVRAGALGGVGRDAMAAGLAAILPGVPVTP